MGKIIVGWIAIVFAAMALVATIPIWLAAPAVAAIVAFLHAPALASRLSNSSLPQPDVIARRGKRPPYFRLPRGAISAGLGSDLPLYLPLLAGASIALVIAAFMFLVAGYSVGSIGSAMCFAAVILGSVLSYFCSRRVYTWRFNELLLESHGGDTGNAGRIARISIGGSVAVAVLAGAMVVAPAVNDWRRRASSERESPQWSDVAAARARAISGTSETIQPRVTATPALSPTKANQSVRPSAPPKRRRAANGTK